MADLILTHNDLKVYLAERGIDLKTITRTRAIINVEVKEEKKPHPFRFPEYMDLYEFHDDLRKNLQSWDLNKSSAQMFMEAHRTRKKIQCIKILRNEFGISLKGAKDFYEANENQFDEVFNVKRENHVY